VWSYCVYVHVPDPKKLDHRFTRWHFLGFTKSCLIVQYFDPTTSTVKHASAVRFDEYNTRLYENDKLSPGALILSGTNPPTLEPYTTVDIIDKPHLETPPFTIQLALPPLPTLLGCEFSSDTYHNLPLVIFLLVHLSPLSLLLHGRYSSSFLILSISQEFITDQAVVTCLQSLHHPTNTIYLPCILSRRVASTRTSLAGSRALFNQICLISEPLPKPPEDASPSSIIQVGCKVWE
jgi:hypothetical protein